MFKIDNKDKSLEPLHKALTEKKKENTCFERIEMKIIIPPHLL